jgi:hypothetical protein
MRPHEFRRASARVPRVHPPNRWFHQHRNAESKCRSHDDALRTRIWRLDILLVRLGQFRGRQPLLPQA